jgi:hypothetical protein
LSRPRGSPCRGTWSPRRRASYPCGQCWTDRYRSAKNQSIPIYKVILQVLFYVGKQHCFPESLPLTIDFLPCSPDQVPLRQKVAGSCGSGSTTLSTDS